MDRRKLKTNKSRLSRKSTCSEGTRKNSKSILSPIDFNSETLSSSSPKPDIVIKTKVRRKKIRCTQDFNQLNTSLTSQDSDVSIKSDTKRTKKIKGMYALPKITNLLEDPLADNENNSQDIFMESNITRKKSSRKRKKSSTKRTKETDSVEQSISAAQLINKPEDYENRLRKILSDDCMLTTKGNSENNKCLNIRKSLVKIPERKFVRKSRSIGNENILQNYDIGHNSRCDSLDQYSLVLTSNKKGKIKYSSCVDEINETGRYVRSRDSKEKLKRDNSRKTTSELSNIKFQVIEDSNKRGGSHARSTFMLDHKDTKQSETKSNISFILNVDDGNISDDVFNVELLKQDNIRRSTFDVDKCTSSIKLFNEKSVEIISNVADNVNDDIKSDVSDLSLRNVISDSYFKGTKQKLQEKSCLIDKSSKLNSPYKYFLSETQTINRSNEIDLPSPICGSNTESSMRNSLTFTNESSAGIGRDSLKNFKNKKSEDNIRNNHQLIRGSQSIIDLSTPYEKKLCKQSDNTFSIKSPYENSAPSSSIKKLRRESTFSKNNVTNNEPNLNTTFNNNLCNLNNDSQNIEVLRGSALNSSLNKISEPSTVIILKTPKSEKVYKSTDVIIVERGSLEKCKQAHSLKSGNNLDISSDMTPIENYLGICNESIKSSITPKLNRTATFIKDDIKCNSITKGIDTSKVTKRRQWNKSRLSMSFLDSSVDIGNVSAPWKGDTLNDTFKISNRDQSVVLDGLRSTTKRGEIYGSPLLGTSTPLPELKKNLLKEVLSKGKNVTINESKNVTKVSGKSESKPVVKAKSKMPNFALIHQRAYEKLESLKEMSERKAQRAKLLLSGCKPGSSTSMNTSSKSKKILQFDPVKSTKVSPIKTTKINESGKKLLLNSSIISITKIKDISPSRSNPNVVALNKLTPIEKKKDLLKAKASRIPTKINNNIAPEKKNVTKYGFKARSVDVKKITKEEQLRAVATKTRVAQNTIEKRRNVIQGVRSNRRFELLMGLRKK